MPDHIEVLPDADDPVTAGFWQGTLHDRLLMQRCGDCGLMRWPPTPLCTHCQSSRARWDQVPAAGQLYSYVTYRFAFDKRLEPELPYSVGMVQIRGTEVKMIGRLIAEPADLTIGAMVVATFHQVSAMAKLVCWRLDDPGAKS